jgi:hypothetical protein
MILRIGISHRKSARPNEPAAPVAPCGSQDRRRRGIRPHPDRTGVIMDSPGRLLRARRDRDRASSGEKRAPQPEADVVVPVVGCVPVAVGRAEVPRIVVPGTAAKDTATRGRPGLRAAGPDHTSRPGRSRGAGATYLRSAHARSRRGCAHRCRRARPFRRAIGRVGRGAGCGSAARCLRAAPAGRRREVRSRGTSMEQRLAGSWSCADAAGAAGR